MWIVDKTLVLKSNLNIRVNIEKCICVEAEGTKGIVFVFLGGYNHRLWLYKNKKLRDEALAKIDELLEVKSI